MSGKRQKDMVHVTPANRLLTAYRRLEKQVGKPDERPMNRAERRAAARRAMRRG